MTDYNTYLEEALENIKSIFAHDYAEQQPIVWQETPATDESITYDTPTASAADSTSSTGSYNGTSVTGSFNPLKYAQNFLTKWEGFVYTVVNCFQICIFANGFTTRWTLRKGLLLL